MPTTKPLREQLRAAFGVDLPVRGGRGTAAAPIVIAAAQLQEAVDVQMQVLACLGMGSGAAWRLVGQEVVAPRERLVRAIVESIVMQDDEATTRHEAIYFIVEALPPGAAATALPSPSGFVDPRSGVRLPRQLGWLHLRGATDNEPHHPGLGFTVAYESRGMHGTVSVYDRQECRESDDVDSERVVDEFRAAVAGVIGANPGARIRHQALFKDSHGDGRCLLAILDLPDATMSAVLLTVAGGCFVQARLTFDATDRESGRMAHETMEAFVDAVRPIHAASG